MSRGARNNDAFYWNSVKRTRDITMSLFGKNFTSTKQNTIASLASKYDGKTQLAKSAQAMPDLSGLGGGGNAPVDLNAAFAPILAAFSASQRMPLTPAAIANVMHNAAQAIDSFVIGSQDKATAMTQVSAKLNELKSQPLFGAEVQKSYLPMLMQSSKALSGEATLDWLRSWSPAKPGAPAAKHAPAKPAPAAKPAQKPAAPGFNADQMHDLINKQNITPFISNGPKVDNTSHAAKMLAEVRKFGKKYL